MPGKSLNMGLHFKRRKNLRNSEAGQLTGRQSAGPSLMALVLKRKACTNSYILSFILNKTRHIAKTNFTRRRTELPAHIVYGHTACHRTTHLNCYLTCQVNQKMATPSWYRNKCRYCMSTISPLFYCFIRKAYFVSTTIQSGNLEGYL